MTKLSQAEVRLPAIAIVGYGVAAPQALIDSHRPWLSTLAVPPETLGRKAQRFACRSGAEAISACRRAFEMADIDPLSLGTRVGLYTSQAGLQHSDIDDYAAAVSQWRQRGGDDYRSLISHLWQSREVNPFLAIKGLSNNLLGMISVLWSLRGDCAAFVRDQAGAGAALSEAVFNLQQGYIDTALVVSAGTECDQLESVFLDRTDDSAGLSGAVALVLRRQADAPQAISYVSTVERMKLTSKDGPERQQMVHTSSILQQGYCFPEQELRWGGILLSLSWLLHHSQNNVSVYSRVGAARVLKTSLHSGVAYD